MKVRKIKNKEAIISDIRNTLSACKDAKFYHRLDLVLLSVSGIPVKEIAALYKEPAKTISTWTKNVIENGVDALMPGSHTGRPSRLTNEQLQQLDSDLMKSPNDFGYEVNSWDGVVLSKHLRDHYNVFLKVRQCQRIIRQLEYTLQRPTTKPYGGNPVEQAEFKKN